MKILTNDDHGLVAAIRAQLILLIHDPQWQCWIIIFTITEILHNRNKLQMFSMVAKKTLN